MENHNQSLAVSLVHHMETQKQARQVQSEVPTTCEKPIDIERNPVSSLSIYCSNTTMVKLHLTCHYLNFSYI